MFAVTAGLSQRDPSQPEATLQPSLCEMNFCARRRRRDWLEESSLEGSRGNTANGKGAYRKQGDDSQAPRDQLTINNLVDPYE